MPKQPNKEYYWIDKEHNQINKGYFVVPRKLPSQYESYWACGSLIVPIKELFENKNDLLRHLISENDLNIQKLEEQNSNYVKQLELETKEKIQFLIERHKIKKSKQKLAPEPVYDEDFWKGLTEE